MKVVIGSDHGGFELKSKLIEYFKDIEFIDVGPFDTTSVDYPDYAFKAVEKIQNKEVDFGILICSTGIGISIAANKAKGIRCALVTDVLQAKLTRCHNNANCLALGSFITTFEKAKEIVQIFLNTEFENGRHLNRIKKITKYEENLWAKL